jgi:hypothetical protein
MTTSIIRVSPKLSNTTVQGWFKDKLSLFKVCLKSYLLAGCYNAQNIYILDKCPREYRKIVGPYADQIIETNFSTKKETIANMYEVARKMAKGNVIFFLEDDYLWRPDKTLLVKLNAATKHFGLASPYDHPGHYEGNICHHIEVFNKELWRRAMTGTHTFAITKSFFMEHQELFNYGEHDWQQLIYLHINGVTLFTPVHSYATHLAEGCLSFGYDWKLISH